MSTRIRLGLRMSLALCLLSIIWPSMTFEMTQQEKPVNWTSVRVRYDAFLGYPSSENAKLLMESLPITKPSPESGVNLDIVASYIFYWDNYLILEREVLAGNRYAAETVIRLLNVFDGAYSEQLLATLGFLVRINPKLFLQVLANNQENAFLKAGGCPVLAVEPAYYDRMSARLYELRMRVSALHGVVDKDLSTVRDECIRSLRRTIDKYESLKSPVPSSLLAAVKKSQFSLERIS